ncbi:MAG: saccharopine dehydrogenase C-terminal domain-containing protein [Pyrinomonadaceae bacterium]
MSHKIFIAGTGGIGKAAALLLREWCSVEIELYLGDVSEKSLAETRQFVTHLSQRSGLVETVLMPADGISDEMKSAFENCEVLLDCSPGGQAPRMARFAKDFKMHYANLTEYVAETDEIMELAKNAETGFVLQTGLAPGYINVLAMSLYNQFVADFGNEKVERIVMKVGALSAHAHAPHFYGFTWSPIGVATEYVKDSRVVREHEITQRPALSEREKIVIGGRHFEADLTSGGAADLPDYFSGIARTLDYKTLRHPGHYSWVEEQIGKLEAGDDLPDRLLEVFLKEIPAVEDDFVLVHAAVDGFDLDGTRRMVEKACFVNPMEINGHYLRAIQTTTAAPLCESAMLLLTGHYKGVVLQSGIDPHEFMNGNFVSRVYG